jgi:type 1 glutamine amidotransferase
MTEANLKQYTMLIFPSTNNDVFDTNDQRLAFRRYIEAGGGFVGIHSVTGTERNWKWFKMMMGGTFSWHAKFQKFSVRMVDPLHSSVQGLPSTWTKEDEFYFAKELYPGPKVLMAHDITTLDTTDAAEKANIIKNAGTYAELYPSVWVHDFDGGHTWFTTLGHDKKDYSDPVYMQHILQGIRYVASRYTGLDFKKAYANSWNATLNY